MEIQDGQMQYEQQEYQMAYNSSQTNSLNDLLLAKHDDLFIDIITRLRNDSDLFSTVYAQLKLYSLKNKDSTHLKNLYLRIIKLMNNLKEIDTYTTSQKQKSIIWIFEKLCCGDKIFPFSQQIQQLFIKIFKDFTNFEDLSVIIKLARIFNTKGKHISKSINSSLNNLFYDKILSQNQLKFVQTIKILDDQKKLILKTQILNYFISDASKYKIQQNQTQSIIQSLKNNSYQKLFETVIQKKFKTSKNIRLLYLKGKMEIIQDKLQLIFSSKCQINKQLKTRQNFQLVAKKCQGNQLLPQIDADSLIIHGDYMFTKWSSEILQIAKQKIGYEDTQERLNDGFLKILGFLKKIFEHRHKRVQSFSVENKIIQQLPHDHVPQQTINYFCHALQLFVKYLSVNSLQINHRSHNLSEVITIIFFDQILQFFQEQIKKNEKGLVHETIDYLITFSAHLFYRRDFQVITPITSKTSQTIIKILLHIQNFPYKWNVLRNYKLVIDRWGETVQEGSEQMRKLAQKFLAAYFNQKVIIHSKSSSTVFNPIFITRPYCKIFGSQFLKCVQNFQKSLQQLQSKTNIVTPSREMDQIMSKIILFMSARVRFQDANKIAQHLNNIYRKYAHIVPQIYLFRSWIMQVNFSKVTSIQMGNKLSSNQTQFKNIYESLNNLTANVLLSPIKIQTQQQINQLQKKIITYQSTHFKLLNCLQIKTKNQEYGQQIFSSLWKLILNNIQLYYNLTQKINQFQKLNKQQYQLLKQQNQLLTNTKFSSIYSIIQKLKNNFICIIRYFICNADKLLSVKDCSILMHVLGQWIKNQVNQVDKNKEKFYYYLNQFINITGSYISTDIESHLTKNQILGAMRSVNGGSQLGLTKNNQISFNQVSSLYEKVKPVYTKFIKLVLQYGKQNKTQGLQKDQVNKKIKTLLNYIIFPVTNIAGSCSFNGKIQQKSSEDMVLGVFWQQAECIFKDFSINQLLNLHQKYPLNNMLQITKNKSVKITQIKANRNNPNNIFQGLRQNRGMNQAMQQLRQVNIPQDLIQIAMQNIQVPDAQIALQWIQNNQDRIQTLIIQKALKQSKQQSMNKQQKQIKSQNGKICQVKYNQFIQNLQKSLKNIVKSSAKQLFSQNGKKITKILFVILDAFKDDFKKKQYQNFAKKMFEQINNLNGKQKFDDKKYRLILQILNYTMKKQTNMYNQYYKQKDGIFIKVLSFVQYFGASYTDQKQKQKQIKQDFKQLLEILNQTLPQLKQPIKQQKVQFIKYLNCILDVVQLSNQTNKQAWQILYKISSFQNKQLKDKIIKLFSKIILSKRIPQQSQQIKSKQKIKIPKLKIIINNHILEPICYHQQDQQCNKTKSFYCQTYNYKQKVIFHKFINTKQNKQYKKNKKNSYKQIQNDFKWVLINLQAINNFNKYLENYLRKRKIKKILYFTIFGSIPYIKINFIIRINNQNHSYQSNMIIKYNQYYIRLLKELFQIIHLQGNQNKKLYQIFLSLQIIIKYLYLHQLQYNGTNQQIKKLVSLNGYQQNQLHKIKKNINFYCFQQ